MVSNLLIVESGSKAKTISKILNNSKNLSQQGDFHVIASQGHIEDLAKKELGIDIENNWKPIYEVLKDKKKLIQELKKQVEKSDNIYLSGDADREGEAISESLRRVLKLKDYKRITYNEITQKALEYAIKNPRKIDDKLVDAQFTRRALDRVVGFKLSPLLWQKYNCGGIILSAGRVQSVILNIIIERENEISNFKGESYWHFLGNFILKTHNEKYQLDRVSLYKNKTIYKTNQESLLEWFSDLSEDFYVKKLSNKLVKKNPDHPFITSTLQQEAYSKLGYNLKKTMSIAQELYEGGLITYHRTDSFVISDDFKMSSKTYIESTWGKEYWSDNSHKFKKIKASQEAHECIRITKIELSGLDDKFTSDQQKLYSIIWKKTVASLMSTCIYDTIELHMNNTALNDEYYFLTSIKKIKFNGFMIIYGYNNDDYDFANIFNNQGLKCIDILAKNTFTNPPSRYNEGTIVKYMERTGIGRPSSYSSIISKIIEKKYIVLSNKEGVVRKGCDLIWKFAGRGITEIETVIEVGKENFIFIPTKIGIEINKFLKDNFDYIVNCEFTSLMETDLDSIANGSKDYLDVLNLFWSKFGSDIKCIKESNADNNKKLKLECSENHIVLDGINYIIRLAKYGPVIQYNDKKNKVQYINLKYYLKHTKKDYMDINENDIRLLKELPKKILTLDDTSVIIKNGIYGIYISYGNKNCALSPRMIIKWIKEGFLEESDAREAIKFHDEKKNKNK